MRDEKERVPASSLVKHIGGFILKTFPCSPPFPIRIPSSTVKSLINEYNYAGKLQLIVPYFLIMVEWS